MSRARAASRTAANSADGMLIPVVFMPGSIAGRPRPRIRLLVAYVLGYG